MTQWGLPPNGRTSCRRTNGRGGRTREVCAAISAGGGTCGNVYQLYATRLATRPRAARLAQRRPDLAERVRDSRVAGSGDFRVMLARSVAATCSGGRGCVYLIGAGSQREIDAIGCPRIGVLRRVVRPRTVFGDGKQPVPVTSQPVVKSARGDSAGGWLVRFESARGAGPCRSAPAGRRRRGTRGLRCRPDGAPRTRLRLLIAAHHLAVDQAGAHGLDHQRETCSPVVPLR